VTGPLNKLGNGYTLAEEIAHVITHGAGAILSIAGLTWMLYLSIGASDPWRIAASVIYGLSLVSLFTASALYHSFHSHAKRHLFEVLDHCAIYLLIAGTYTPFLLVSMRNGTGWLLFGTIWILATAGIITQLYFRDRYPKMYAPKKHYSDIHRAKARGEIPWNVITNDSAYPTPDDLLMRGIEMGLASSTENDYVEFIKRIYSGRYAPPSQRVRPEPGPKEEAEFIAYERDPQAGGLFMKRLAEVIAQRLRHRTDKLVESWYQAFGEERL